MVCLSVHLCFRSSVSLVMIHYPYVLNGCRHVRVVVATIDAGLDIERLRVHVQSLLALALFPVDNGDVVVRRRHVRDAPIHEVFGYENFVCS